MKFTSSTKMGVQSDQMENWLSLTNRVNKNRMKLGRANVNFFHLGTNYRHFCCTIGVHKLNTPQDQSVVVEQRMVGSYLTGCCHCKGDCGTVVPEYTGQIASCRFWLESVLLYVPWWRVDKIFKFLWVFWLLWLFPRPAPAPAVPCCCTELIGIEKYLTFLF